MYAKIDFCTAVRSTKSIFASNPFWHCLCFLLCFAKRHFCTAFVFCCAKNTAAPNTAALNPFLSLPVLSHVGGTPNIFLHQKQTKIQHVLTVIKRPTKNISALFTFFACNVFIFYILFAAFLKVCLTCILIL